jgi:hypothetical protein
MKYSRFEDLPVWQAAATLAADMFGWTSQAVFAAKVIWAIKSSGRRSRFPTISPKGSSGERQTNC